MAKLIGDRLPAAVREAFSGEALEGKVGLAYLLITADSDETPRPCMLSAGEILAVDERRLRLALWAGTHTSQNLSRGARAVLCFTARDTVLYLKGRPRSLGSIGERGLAGFEVEIDSVESDRHPGMPVTETITFRVEGSDAAEVAAEWGEQLEALRQA